MADWPSKKNAAFNVHFPIYDNDGDLVTGAAGLDSEVSIDHGTFTDCTNEATEIATSSGVYYLTLTQAEMNGDIITTITKTSTANAKTAVNVMYTVVDQLADIHADLADVHTDVGTAVTDIAAVHVHVADIHDTDLPAVKADTAAILIDTAVIGALGAGLTGIPWNAAWDAEVQSEAQDAITASALATAANLATVDTVVDGIATDVAAVHVHA
jgi:hypothetical protein